MLAMLIAYDGAGNVIATLGHVVAKDAHGNVIGLVDFEAHELGGGELLDVWNVDGAAGSATWPEWIGSRAHDFRVELAGGRIKALVHKDSGFRRERAAIEAAIEERVVEATLRRDTGRKREAVADIRAIVGGPDRPLVLDDEGRTVTRQPPPERVLPVIRSERPPLA